MTPEEYKAWFEFMSAKKVDPYGNKLIVTNPLEEQRFQAFKSRLMDELKLDTLEDRLFEVIRSINNGEVQ